MAPSLFKDVTDPELGCEWNRWDWAAHDHPAFKDAFEALVAEGCDGWVLLEILEQIQNCQDLRASPDDLRRIRAALDQGRDALVRLIDDDDPEVPF